MSKSRLLVSCLVLAFMSPAVEAGETSVEELKTTIESLKARIKDQDRRIDELEAQQSKNQDQQTKFLHLYKKLQHNASEHDSDFRVYWDDGLRMKNGEGFKIKFGGRLMYDIGWIDGDDLEDHSDLAGSDFDLEDAADVRRARLYFQGDIYEDLQFKLQFDLADCDADLKDAYLRFKNIPYLGSVTMGHFKEPFSLEELTSSKYITFMERGLPNAMSPGRNVGVMAHNSVLDDRMTWAVGIFRDVDDCGQDDPEENDEDGGYNMTARVTAAPWYAEGGRKVLHLGGSYSLRHPQEQSVRFRARPEAHFLAERFTDVTFGAEWENRFGAEAALVCGPFSAQAEYMAVVPDAGGEGDVSPTLQGAYAYVSYFLTGEHRNYSPSSGTFKRVRPKKNFRQDGGLGAWEVGARWSWLDFTDNPLEDTDDGARELNNVTLGVNWYLNPNVRIMWNWVHPVVEDEGPADDWKEENDIFMMRMQVDF